MIKNLSYLVLSDIHLGNNKNKTKDIVANLNCFFKTTIEDLDLNIIFIAGDIFDNLLNCSSIAYFEALEWFYNLLFFCKRKNIKLRILEGTPSHDWKQARVIDLLSNKLDVNLDTRYIDKLFIEYIEDFDIHVLYVPDEWNSEYSKTFDQVKILLSDLNISKVDIAIMHGQFNYQLPITSDKIQKHNEHDYLSIVKYFISVGHIHTFSVYERIIAQGSFDRLAHGEEEPKGGVYFNLNHQNPTYYFLENKKAKTFLTIDIKNRNVDSSLEFIKKKLQKIPPNSHIRIKGNKDNPVLVNFEETKKMFLEHFLTKKINEEEDYILIKEPIFNENYIPININRENIEDLLLTSIKEKYTFTEDLLGSFRFKLKEIIS